MRLFASRAAKIGSVITIILHTFVFASSWYGAYQTHVTYMNATDKAGTFCWGCSLAWLPVQLLDLPVGILIQGVNRIAAFFIYPPGSRHFNIIYLDIGNVWGSITFFLFGTLQWLLIGACIGFIIHKIRSKSSNVVPTAH